MEYVLSLKTRSFLLPYAKEEIKRILKIDPKEKDKNLLEITIKDKNELAKSFYSLFYFSRTIESISLDDNLFADDLFRREHKLNTNPESLPAELCIFLFYYMGIEKEKKISALDPMANLGDLIIELSLFVNKAPLNLKKRYKNRFSELLGVKGELPRKEEPKSTFTGIVQDNRDFKLFKENLAYSSQKIKMSQFDFSWLDVKFQKGEFDYIVTYLPSQEELQDQLLYQAEHICKKKTGVICEGKIDEKLIKKHKLEAEKNTVLEVDSKVYHVYSLIKGKKKR